MMLLFFQQIVPDSPLSWVIKYAPTVGWPAVFTILWKAQSFLNKAEARAIAAETSIKNADTSIAEIKKVLVNTVDANKAFITKVESSITNSEKTTSVQIQVASDILKNLDNLRESFDSHNHAEEDILNLVQQLMESTKHQSEVFASLFEILRGIAKDQAVLATNQTNITTGFQRVVEQLINIVNLNKG